MHGSMQEAWMVGFISYVLRTVLLVHLTIGYGVALVHVSRTGHHSAVELISVTVASLMAVWLQHACIVKLKQCPNAKHQLFSGFAVYSSQWGYAVVAGIAAIYSILCLTMARKPLCMTVFQPTFVKW